jgi:hypothetical protein
MSNSSTTANIYTTEFYVVAYYPLCLVVVGTILNLLTFITLCRAPFRNTKKHPAMHYLRAIAIFDILMLYGWNLDHYLSGIHGFAMVSYTIASCKFFGFLNYFTAQSSAWLRVFICIDRYFTLSRLNQTWLSHSKNVLIIIACIITILSILNSPLLIVVCYYRANGTISIYSPHFKTYPLWDYINLGVYNCAPFILMVIFNSGVIYHLIQLRRTTTVHNSRVQHRAISIILVITTFLFSFMTIPGTVAYAFFADPATSLTTLHAFDAMLYTYHILSFPLYFLTLGDFRRECIAMITCTKNTRRVMPLPAV